ncbi:MAG: pyrroline-5-carboxylate reductase [Bacilli bacterium]|nr:pyrroline-5-carboxylate reductase [Bacilli bacterium]
MKIGFIGVGHMGSSLARAIKDYQNVTLCFNDIDNKKALALKEEIPNSVVKDFNEIVGTVHYLFIGVKPNDAGEVFKRIKEINSQVIIISMVAGKKISDIKDIIVNPVIRILPNTPVAIKSGLTLYNYSSDITNNDLKTFLDFMKETGELVEVEEDKINAISVITGSAPAYLDYFIDALIKALEKEGVDKKEATYYALMMALGTIKLDLNSNKSPLDLGKEVCSPNGSTIEGIDILLKRNLYDIVEEAFQATLKKNNKMVED